MQHLCSVHPRLFCHNLFFFAKSAMNILLTCQKLIFALSYYYTSYFLVKLRVLISAFTEVSKHLLKYKMWTLLPTLHNTHSRLSGIFFFFLATKKMMRYFLSSISMHSFTVTCMLQCCWCCVSAACLANLHFFEDEFVPYAVLSDQSSFKLRLLSTEGKIQEPFFQRSVGLTEHLVRVRVDRGGVIKTSKHYIESKIWLTIELYFPFFFTSEPTLSNMRLSRRGTTGKTVGRRVFKSSIKSLMSPWKKPIRPPWMRMTPWREHRVAYTHKIC